MIVVLGYLWFYLFAAWVFDAPSMAARWRRVGALGALDAAMGLVFGVVYVVVAVATSALGATRLKIPVLLACFSRNSDIRLPADALSATSSGQNKVAQSIANASSALPIRMCCSGAKVPG